MMACSYLSAAGAKPATAGASGAGVAGCWTPPNYTCLPEPDSLPGNTQPPCPQPCPQAHTTSDYCALGAPRHEPALDLTTNSSSVKPRVPSPTGDTE
ncbi:hypothetical protein RR46_13146 [Papilio xuthus]|uniref:Uncharacterized protein n=1 Tax=Papilio xuthus TaxID=66420 RepID=A0A194PKL8_PAPXU|nr:hypothetical protein RR46_13146 [Papilio xuthus]